MGRLFVAASSNRLSNTAPALTGKPLSMSCWYKPVSFTQQAGLVVLQSNTTANRQYMIAVQTTATPIANERGSGAGGAGNGPATITANTWAHIGGTFGVGSSGARTCYVNGVAGTPNTAGVGTVPTAERTDIGGYFVSSVGTFASLADGIIAEVGIWNVILTAGEMVALARGVSPLSVRPGNLAFFAPLYGTGSPEPDYTVGQHALTASGTSGAAHPPVAPMLFGLSATSGLAALGSGGGGTASSLPVLGAG